MAILSFRETGLKMGLHWVPETIFHLNTNWAIDLIPLLIDVKGLKRQLGIFPDFLNE